MDLWRHGEIWEGFLKEAEAELSMVWGRVALGLRVQEQESD